MLTRRVLIALAAAFGLLLGTAVPANAEVFDLWAQHPSIAAQPESGQGISDLAVHGGDLYMGYGDYSANTGPIDIATVNLATGATSVKATANTEAILTYRLINGKLYAPWTDPKGVGGIYSSNQSGTWDHYGLNVENVHIYDVAVLPNGVQVAVGSANASDRSTFLGATAFVSYDNGATWRIEMTDLTSAKDPNVSGYERYYWVTVIKGKAYMQARDAYAAYGVATFPLRVFDGVRWTSGRKSADCFVGSGHDVESFNGKAYCTNGRVFDGRRATTTGGIYADDFFQYNGTLYALSSDRVMRLEGTVWVQEAVFLSDRRGRSLAVTSTHYYVGDAAGRVHRFAH